MSAVGRRRFGNSEQGASMKLGKARYRVRGADGHVERERENIGNSYSGIDLGTKKYKEDI